MRAVWAMEAGSKRFHRGIKQLGLHSCDIFAKDVAVFCPGSKNLLD